MDNGTKSQPSNLTDREEVKFNKQLIIYLFFLLISLCFWYLNALSKDYITEIYYTVNYKDLPNGKILAPEVPSKIGLKVKGFGFTILRCKLTAYIRPMMISLKPYLLESTSGTNSLKYFILTSYSKEDIASQLPNEMQLLDVKPDTLFLKLTEVVEKKVPVKPRVSLEFAEQFMQGKLMVKPDSVTISGPKAVLDTISSVETNELKKRKVNDTILQSISLTPISDITFQPKKVSLIIPVYKYTELTLNIPIEAENLPDSLFLRTFPNNINLSCWVAVSQYDKMSPYLFKAVVDYKSVNNFQLHDRLRVNLIKVPANVTNVSFYPRSVEYLIER